MRAKTITLAAAAGLAAALAGCSLGDEPSRPPQLGTRSRTTRTAAEKLGFPSTATQEHDPRGRRRRRRRCRRRGERRLPGHERLAPADRRSARGQAPTGRPASRPRCSRPARSARRCCSRDGDELPPVTADTLERLNPKGSDLSKDAQVIRIGDKPARPSGFKTAVIEGRDPYERAAAIDRFFSAAKGKPSRNVIVASGEEAAVRDARRGVGRPLGRLGAARAQERRPASRPREALKRAREAQHLSARPQVGHLAEGWQGARGSSARSPGSTGPTPVENAIEFARFERGGFGWGVDGARLQPHLAGNSPSARRGGLGGARHEGRLRPPAPHRCREGSCPGRSRPTC